MSRYEEHKNSRRILLLMSGSIACAKASTLISDWTRLGHKVRVACTRSVAEFVGPASLQGLGAEMVFENVFAPGHAMEHISLGKWADIVIAAPATSNLINKLSAGIADDAVSTLWQAAYGQGKPMVIVPAMNTRMWRYPATQESVKRLKQWGIHVLPVGKGQLACGELGEGRMFEPLEIMKTVENLLAFEQKVKVVGSKGKRILITAGGTRERIDSVRYIGNMSTGQTATRLADEMSRVGHTVTWLGARDAVQPGSVDSLESYYSFADLEAQLRLLLGSEEYDLVIHAAAVSDFSVDSIKLAASRPVGANGGKLSSEAGLVVHLTPNPKLLDCLKSWSVNPELLVIGFKLTDTNDQHQRVEAIKKQFDQSGVDAVVHNDLSEISQTAHPFYLYVPARKAVRCIDSEALAQSINEFVQSINSREPSDETMS